MKTLSERVDQAYKENEKLGYLDLEDLFEWLDNQDGMGVYTPKMLPDAIMFEWHLRDIKEAKLVITAWKRTK